MSLRLIFRKIKDGGSRERSPLESKGIWEAIGSPMIGILMNLKVLTRGRELVKYLVCCN